MRTVLRDIGCGAGGLWESRRWVAVGAVSLLWSVAACPQQAVRGSAGALSAGQSRPFLMGFTAFPYDITSEAVEGTRRFVRDNADLIAHHIEGVPWAETLRDCGLVDEKGVGRPAYGVWREYFEKPWSR